MPREAGAFAPWAVEAWAVEAWAVEDCAFENCDAEDCAACVAAPSTAVGRSGASAPASMGLANTIAPMAATAQGTGWGRGARLHRTIRASLRGDAEE
jgi:hypothetical protein